MDYSLEDLRNGPGSLVARLFALGSCFALSGFVEAVHPCCLNDAWPASQCLLSQEFLLNWSDPSKCLVAHVHIFANVQKNIRRDRLMELYAISVELLSNAGGAFTALDLKVQVFSALSVLGSCVDHCYVFGHLT